MGPAWPTTSATIGVHFLTGLLLVLGYWLQGRFF